MDFVSFDYVTNLISHAGFAKYMLDLAPETKCDYSALLKTLKNVLVQEVVIESRVI
jgi:hypothetical protein